MRNHRSDTIAFFVVLQETEPIWVMNSITISGGIRALLYYVIDHQTGNTELFGNISKTKRSRHNSFFDNLKNS